ncbi:MAG: hypothetical protein GXP17_00330 [Gammaproteobacteria bacterium]|nr:hypothetical protein [Gammaproteobacteria bacterium]
MPHWFTNRFTNKPSRKNTLTDTRPKQSTRFRAVTTTLLLFGTLLGLDGCSTITSSASSQLAENVTRGLLSQDDLTIARLGTPAYLVLIDGLIESNPGNTGMLTAGAELYGAYTGAFVNDATRRKRLTQKALDYSRRALCLQMPSSCNMHRLPYSVFLPLLKTVSEEHVGTLYRYAVSWIGWIQAHRANLAAVAELPKAQSALEQVLVLDEDYKQGDAHMYLGVLHSLIPPSLGGKHDIARKHFERAFELSGGRNLMAQVLYAEHYARMNFNRPLHDKLLTAVTTADPHQPGYTLSNVLAQERAQTLLASADDFF